MNSEIKSCQNCKKEFEIEPVDFAFYEQVKVPPPTWCPDCRLLRRILWRNDKNLYKRPDSLTGKPIFSMYPEHAPVKVYERDYWFGDSWDAMDYGRNYDFTRPFFDQVRDLIRDTPLMSRAVSYLVNSEYSNNAHSLKDCYLAFGAAICENCIYCLNVSKSKDCIDSSYLTECEISYGSFFNEKCSSAFFSSHCESSHDIFFSRNCVGVSNCFGCVGLRNKSYYIFNKPYSKENYATEIAKFNLGSASALDEMKRRVAEFWAKYPVKYLQGRHNTEVSGEYISNSSNVKESYHIINGENLRYCQSLYINQTRDSYDYFRFGDNAELIYESAICGLNISRLKFSYDCWIDCSNMEYCVSCHSSSFLFGCVGLRNKQYCILNKQYTKEDYEVMLPKIKKHLDDMPYTDKGGRVYTYGEFFPPDLSPFAYNETIAPETFPISKEEALAKGYEWREEPAKSYQATVKAADLPEHINDAKDEIVNEVIECAHEAKCKDACVTAFRILPQELAFLRAHGLPLPRLCWRCRDSERLRQRSPMKYYAGRCACAGKVSGAYTNTAEHAHGASVCTVEFKTAYAPGTSGLVYCEACYNAEVA